MASNSRFQTDSLTPSSLPTANLGRRRPLAGPSTSAPFGSGIAASTLGEGSNGKSRSDAELDRVRDEWNLRIDKEIKGVVSGLKELVELADITPTPQKSIQTLLPLHMKIKTSTLIRSAQNLRNVAHELKLLLLLSDDVESARRRDSEAAIVRREITNERREVVKEVERLLGGQGDRTEDDPEEEDGGEEEGRQEFMEPAIRLHNTRGVSERMEVDVVDGDRSSPKGGDQDEDDFEHVDV